MSPCGVMIGNRALLVTAVLRRISQPLIIRSGVLVPVHWHAGPLVAAEEWHK